MARDAFLQRFAFLLTDQQHFVLFDLGKSGADCQIVAEIFVAVQLDELVKHKRQVIAGQRPVRMPRNFHGLPGIQAAEDAFLQIAQLTARVAAIRLAVARLESRADSNAAI